MINILPLVVAWNPPRGKNLTNFWTIFYIIVIFMVISSVSGGFWLKKVVPTFSDLIKRSSGLVNLSTKVGIVWSPGFNQEKNIK